MYGNIIGDLAGSIYEYDQVKKVSKIKINKIIEEKSFISDDTILTIAILDAILNNCKYEDKLKEYGLKYDGYIKPNIPYFKTTFSSCFTNWLNGNYQGTSKGNGAMMRIAPIGYLFDSFQEIEKNVYMATSCSHNDKKSIECATIIAKIIYLARNNYSKQDIINKLNLNIKYKEIKTFNYTCEDTIDNCLYALFTTNSFEESIKTIISYGGDTDTNACIVGGMAEAMYKIDNDLIDLANNKLPDEFVKVLKRVYK